MVANPYPSASTPLSIDPVIGWRAWALRWNGADGVELMSPLQTFVWQPGKPTRARCRTHFGKQVPHIRCGCGLYAVASLDRLPSAGGLASAGIAVVGSVAMWGHVVEHDAGYRGQLGYPDRLRLVCPVCLRSGWDGVPTRIVRGYDGEVRPTCDTHAPAGTRGGEISPRGLQEMVLAAYAVDPLPVEALHRSGFRPGSVPPVGLWPSARAEVRQLTRGWSAMLVVVMLVAAFLAVRALGLVGSPGGAKVATGSPAPVAPSPVVGEPGRTSVAASIPKPERRTWKLPPFGIVCGIRTGDRVEVASCGRSGAGLLGLYDSPPDPVSECEHGNAYSRGRGFSVCWIDVDGSFDGEIERLRVPGVTLRELAE